MKNLRLSCITPLEDEGVRVCKKAPGKSVPWLFVANKHGIVKFEWIKQEKKNWFGFSEHTYFNKPKHCNANKYLDWVIRLFVSLAEVITGVGVG